MTIKRNTTKIIYSVLVIVFAVISALVFKLFLSSGLVKYAAILPLIAILILAPAAAYTLCGLVTTPLFIVVILLSFGGIFAVQGQVDMAVLIFALLFSGPLIFSFVPKKYQNLRNSLGFVMPGSIVLTGLGVCTFGYFSIGSFSPVVLFDSFVQRAESALLELKDFYNSQSEVLGQELTENVNNYIEQMTAQLSYVTITMIIIAVCFLMLQCFAALRISRYLLKKSGIKYGVWSVKSILPTRGVGYAYIALFIIALLPILTNYYIGMYSALIIFGWIFIITALYSFDRFLLQRHVNVALRRLVQVVLSAFSLATMSLSIFTPYGILLMIGLFICTVLRGKGIQPNPHK